MLRFGLPTLTEAQALSLVRHHRRLARQLFFAGAAVVLVVVPLYQLQELVQAVGPPDLWQKHFAWRALPVVVAVAGLIWCLVREDGTGAPTLLRLLALTVMVMMFALFAHNWVAQSAEIDRMIRGVIICTFAVTLFSLRGFRELVLYFSLPFLAMLTVLWLMGYAVLPVIVALFDPMMMFIIAAFASELLYRTWLQAFLANQRLAEHASTDPLTGLSNRRHIEPQLSGEIARATRHGTCFSILMADLDHFKRVNDQYGHDVGDEVLREIGRRLRLLLRTEDRPARWGGEEFLVLLTDTGAEQAAIVADKLRRGIADQPMVCEGRELSITISIGVAAYVGEGDPLEIIKRADKALYRAKELGRNRVCVAD